MSSNAIGYAGLYAKTCALRGSLLTYDDYVGLASCQTVKEFGEILGDKKTYKEAVLEAYENGTNRVALERSLIKSLYRDYAAMYSFMTNSSERKYFDVIFMKYEIGLIKLLIRSLYDKQDLEDFIPQYDSFLIDHIGLDVEKLADSNNIEELVENLKGTEFYDLLAKINKESATQFDYELALDFHYYIKTHKFQGKYLDNVSRISQQKINGSDADLHNIMWIFRSKAFYEIDKEKVFTYLIPLHYRLTADTVKSLIDAKDNSEFLAVLDDTKYKGVFKSLTIGEMEKDFNIYMNKQYERERMKNAYSIASVTAHLYAKGQEIKNLTTLIECVRYKLAPNAAMKKLNIDVAKAGEDFD